MLLSSRDNSFPDLNMKPLLSSASASKAARYLGVNCRYYGYVHVPKKTTPHLLGHGSVWRKCLVVHPSTQTEDPLTKIQWLTKTTVISGLPGADDLPNETALNDFEARVRETLVFQPRDDRQKGRMREMCSSLVSSSLVSLWQLGLPHLRHSSLTVDPKVECYWRRNGDNFHCVSNPIHILHTASPLELFCDPDYEGGGGILPVEYKSSHLGLFEHSFDQIEPFGGCKRYSPFSFTHTIFIADWKSRSREHLLAHGIMQLFSQAAGESVQNGYPLDQDLVYPLSSQGILTDGKQFTFLCYQLNTLDLTRSSKGRRQNVLWAGPTLSLYDSIDLGSGLVGYSEECAKQLLQLLLRKPTRKSPSLSGFGVALQEKKERQRRWEERRRTIREIKREARHAQ